MGVKFSSIVMVLLVCFIAKISFESATASNKVDPSHVNERSPASIDQSYHDHLNKR